MQYAEPWLRSHDQLATTQASSHNHKSKSCTRRLISVVQTLLVSVKVLLLSLLFAVAVFKILKLSPDRIESAINLRDLPHKQVNLNYSSNDVQWNPKEGVCMHGVYVCVCAW